MVSRKIFPVLLFVSALLLFTACEPQAEQEISGRITLGEGKPGLSDVSVVIIGDEPATVLTDEEGYWSITARGKLTISPRKAGFEFEPRTRQVEIGQEEKLELDFVARELAPRDFSTWLPVSRLGSHRQLIWAVVWSPSGQKIASGSHDKSVRIWGCEDWSGEPGFTRTSERGFGSGLVSR